jgi:hypothetical protein
MSASRFIEPQALAKSSIDAVAVASRELGADDAGGAAFGCGGGGGGGRGEYGIGGVGFGLSFSLFNALHVFAKSSMADELAVPRDTAGGANDSGGTTNGDGNAAEATTRSLGSLFMTDHSRASWSRDTTP